VAHRTYQVCIVLVVGALTLGLSAQGRGRFTGNPTPGTPQPDPPNLADRITVTGCLRMATQNSNGTLPPAELNTPSDSIFILTNVVRETRVPPATGTSDIAKTSTSRMYRLAAINGALVPFVGSRVEVSGEIDPASLTSPAQVTPSAASGNRPRADTPQGPILHVEFVQRVAQSCS
jgi:hypothetical protein